MSTFLFIYVLKLRKKCILLKGKGLHKQAQHNTMMTGNVSNNMMLETSKYRNGLTTIVSEYTSIENHADWRLRKRIFLRTDYAVIIKEKNQRHIKTVKYLSKAISTRKRVIKRIRTDICISVVFSDNRCS